MGYKLKTLLANRKNYGSKRNTKVIEFLVYHYTANDGDTDENNAKYFQGCQSNKNDIELNRYRICRNGMFAYNKATSRNGEKISIAYREGNDCLISPSYYCFKIVREDLLLADYQAI